MYVRGEGLCGYSGYGFFSLDRQNKAVYLKRFWGLLDTNLDVYKWAAVYSLLWEQFQDMPVNLKSNYLR